MSFLWAIVAGLIIGLLAKLVLPGRQPIPLWMTVLLGIVGGVAGNALASAFGVRDTNGIDWIRHLLQVATAALLITVVTPMWARRHA
ncbi:GlsB/YeaQ/YmgE family stress response membrane protein [Streptomyces pactum]|uniref:GlsB/YeaQ/YmgE family stress response membrane protein n=1 Tax=Streptomyces pactum TaxID=68249 RepID=A0ABS0NFN7_9ACTN|nr:GlsB/YeaQ/YmgE family stress response membrane protein [Streptomyces pactum]MBH5333987.1 GlsB/YeaQ/YmgE family stress response membrane protein [Streptomyces pactum]